MSTSLTFSSENYAIVNATSSLTTTTAIIDWYRSPFAHAKAVQCRIAPWTSHSSLIIPLTDAQWLQQFNWSFSFIISVHFFERIWCSQWNTFEADTYWQLHSSWRNWMKINEWKERPDLESCKKNWTKYRQHSYFPFFVPLFSSILTSRYYSNWNIWLQILPWCIITKNFSELMGSIPSF